MPRQKCGSTLMTYVNIFLKVYFLMRWRFVSFFFLRPYSKITNTKICLLKRKNLYYFKKLFRKLFSKRLFAWSDIKLPVNKTTCSVSRLPVILKLCRKPPWYRTSTEGILISRMRGRHWRKSTNEIESRRRNSVAVFSTNFRISKCFHRTKQTLIFFSRSQLKKF